MGNFRLLIIAFLVFATYSVSVKSQKFAEIEELDRFLLKVKLDTIELNKFNQAFKRSIQNQLEKTVIWSDSLFMHSSGKAMQKIDPLLLFSIGSSLDSIKQYHLAEIYYKQAIVGFNRKNQFNKSVKARCNLAEIYIHQGNYKFAEPIINDLLEETKRGKIPELRFEILAVKAFFHYNRSNSDSALKYYYAALDLAKNHNLNSKYPRLYRLIGNCYYMVADFNKALYYHKKALITNDSTQKIWGYIVLSNDYFELNNIDTALYYGYLATGLSAKQSNTLPSIISYRSLANIFFDTKDYKRSEGFADTCLQIALKSKDKSNIAYAYKILSNASSELNNYKEALNYHQLYHTYYDSLMIQKANMNFAIREMQISSAYKNKEISNLSEENVKQDLTIKRTQFLLILASVLFLSALIIIYINKLKSRHKLSELKQRLTRFQMNPHFIFQFFKFFANICTWKMM